MKINLAGRTAVVCGSTQGIGKASAVQLANIGAKVILVARNEDKLKSSIADLNTSFNQLHSYLVADFSNSNELQARLTKITEPVHILINNTGGPTGGPILEATLDEFESAFNNHLKCNHILVKKFVPSMKEAGYGRIINIISTSVKQPLPNLGVSNTIRGAVASWSKTLANELGQFGITVNNVLPGATKTARLTAIIEKRAGGDSIKMHEIEKEMLKEIPAQRFADASEIAYAVAFLSSPAAGYINGINLPVDGGRLMTL